MRRSNPIPNGYNVAMLSKSDMLQLWFWLSFISMFLALPLMALRGETPQKLWQP